MNVITDLGSVATSGQVTQERALRLELGLCDYFAAHDVLARTFLSGSCAIVGVGNDADVILYVEEKNRDKVRSLLEALFAPCSSKEYSDDTRSAWRRGELNVIWVYSEEEYRDWLTAMLVCQGVVDEFGDISRNLRVMIHRAVRGEDITE